MRYPARSRFLSPFLALLFPLFLSIFPASPADGSGLTRVDARERTASGWSLFEQERWEEALAAFDEAIRSDPGAAEAYRGLAETLYRLGRPAEAAGQIRAGLPHLSTDSPTLVPLAEILGRTASTRPDAIRILRILLEARPGEQETRLALARNLAWSGHYRAAIAECRRVESDSSDPGIQYEARQLEARFQSWKGNYQEAERLYRTLLSERPADAELRIGIADTLAWNGWTRRAGEKYRNLLDGKTAPEAWVGLAEIARWRKRHGEAEELYSRALELQPDHRQALEGIRKNQREAGPELGLRGSSFRDSSDFDRDSLVARYDLFRGHPLALRTGAVRTRYRQADDRQVYRTVLPLQATWKAGPVFSGAAGVARNDYSEGPDSTSYFLHGFLAPPAERVRLRAGFDHYDMIDGADPFGENFYNQALTIDVVALGIDLDEAWAGLTLRFTGRLTWDIDLARADISDGNERGTGFSRISYRVPARDQVVLFGQTYYQEVNERTLLYFDPVDFLSYGLGARWEGERGERFRFLLEGTLGFFPREEDLLGGQLRAYAEWDLGESLSFRVTGNYLNSPEERGAFGESYKATYLGLGLVKQIPLKNRRTAAPAGKAGRE